MGIGWELFECTACLLTGEISKENCNGKISGVPGEYHCSVQGGYIVWKLRMYLRWNI